MGSVRLSSFAARLAAPALCAAALASAPAGAEPARAPAPALGSSALHPRVGDSLAALLGELPAPERARLAGTYVAFDADPSQAYALVACDDDGDAVVVVSDAMIELVERVAEGASADELTGSKKLAAYAAALAAGAPRGARLLPPPPGFYAGPHDAEREGELFDQAIRGLLAHELARLARRHLVCPKPSAARETGDAVWTAAERDFAWKLSERLYDGAHLADADAAAAPWVRGRAKGWAALLDAMAILEASPGAAAVPYARLHPGSAKRAAAVRAAEPAEAEARTR